MCTIGTSCEGWVGKSTALWFTISLERGDGVDVLKEIVVKAA